MGIRAKLNLGVGVVVLLSALLFGTAYMVIERSILLREKHEHLVHVAALMRLSLEGIDDEDALRVKVRQLTNHLSAATGAPHRMRIEDARGQVLITSHPTNSRVQIVGDVGGDSWREEWLPHSMIGVTQIGSSFTSGPAQLVVEESLSDLPKQLRASLVRHLGFAAVLFGVAIAFTTLLAHVLVVRPVLELAAAAEKLGRDGSWDPYSPTVRRDDEIGVLSDRIAELSRRLRDTVREERYGSAHLVAVGVQRSLEDPIRHAHMEIAALEALLSPEKEALQLTARLSDHLEEIAEVGRRLKQIGRPGPS